MIEQAIATGTIACFVHLQTGVSLDKSLEAARKALAAHSRETATAEGYVQIVKEAVEHAL